MLTVACGFDVAPTLPECKLMRAHFEEADVEFREYQPMTSSNKRWSKDELMPQMVRALHACIACIYSALIVLFARQFFMCNV